MKLTFWDHKRFEWQPAARNIGT